jgi:hypothetical protein
MPSKNLLHTSLTPSLFIEVPELRQEESFICVLGTSNLHISTIFLLNAGTVPTVWYIFFHFIIGYEKKTAELQLLKKIWLWSVFRNENHQNEIQPNRYQMVTCFNLI